MITPGRGQPLAKTSPSGASFDSGRRSHGRQLRRRIRRTSIPPDRRVVEHLHPDWSGPVALHSVAPTRRSLASSRCASLLRRSDCLLRIPKIPPNFCPETHGLRERQQKGASSKYCQEVSLRARNYGRIRAEALRRIAARSARFRHSRRNHPGHRAGTQGSARSRRGDRASWVGGNIFRGGAPKGLRDRARHRRLHGHAGHGHQRAGAAGCAGKSRRAHPACRAPIGHESGRRAVHPPPRRASSGKGNAS